MIGEQAPAARAAAPRRPEAANAAAVGTLVVSWVVLERLAPIRPGMLSVLLFGAPAVLAYGGARARTWWRHAACAAATAGVLALAVPVQSLQQAVIGWEWTHAAGVPSRAWLQVIDVPGMPQESYQWDTRSRTLTAYFDIWIDPLYQWADTETVTSARSTPPAALTWAYGDGADQRPARCTRPAPDLWQCVPADHGDRDAVGFVRRSAGVMIILTGSADDRAALLRAIRAAHPASDAELRSRTALGPRSLAGWLLL